MFIDSVKRIGKREKEIEFSLITAIRSKSPLKKRIVFTVKTKPSGSIVRYIPAEKGGYGYFKNKELFLIIPTLYFNSSNNLNAYPSFCNHSMARGIASRIFRSAFKESWKTITEPLRV